MASIFITEFAENISMVRNDKQRIGKQNHSNSE